MNNHSLALVMIVRNEAHRLPHLLRAVKGYVSEIVAVDMESEDQTVEILKEHRANVFPHPKVENFDIARKLAIQKTTSEWIIMLDADEIPTPELLKEITSLIKSSNFDMISIPSANFAYSGFPSHTLEFPHYHTRVFKTSVVDLTQYNGSLHSFFQFKPGSRKTSTTSHFPDRCLLHFSNLTIGINVTKINAYTTAEAIKRYSKLKNAGMFWLYFIVKPAHVFLVHYIKRMGFLDGRRGLFYSMTASMYVYIYLMKIWEMSLHNGKVPTESDARKLIEDKILKDH